MFLIFSQFFPIFTNAENVDDYIAAYVADAVPIYKFFFSSTALFVTYLQ